METFEEYLRKQLSRSESGSLAGSAGGSLPEGAGAEGVRRARARLRALRNWRRAKYAVTKKITQDMLGLQRRWVWGLEE